MDNLFYLYHYLATNQHSTNEENPYATALHTLEPVIDLLKQLDSWGITIRDNGGIEWEQADMIAERIILAHKTALCDRSGNILEAVADFALSHIGLNNIDALIDTLQTQKAEMLKNKQLADEMWEADDHPF